MKCTGKIAGIMRDFKSKNSVLQLEINEDVLSNLEELKDAEKLNISLTRYYEKRSLDANGYFWQLVGQIAQKVKGKSKEDIYRSYIRETGAYEIIPIREDAIKRWSEIWLGKGVGWLVEDIGPCRNTPGYHNIKCYYGSSVYNTQEMSHLIDLVVQDCKELGIETMTPDEINKLKELWK